MQCMTDKTKFQKICKIYCIHKKIHIQLLQGINKIRVITTECMKQENCDCGVRLLEV